MKIIENKSSFDEQELITIAKREKNSKRSFLIVNPSQGKHIPVSPEKPLQLFKELSLELKKHRTGERTLFVAFAETATAIGACVASEFADSRFITTTREIIPSTEMIVDFKEEHSHAVQQTLQCDNWKKLSEGVNEIIFVEDEITTGTTILNFINAIKANKRIGPDVKFSAVSIINGMTEERTEELLKEGVEFFYLVKISIDNMNPEFKFEDKGEDSPLYEHGFVLKKHHVLETINPRTGCKTQDYINACNSFAHKTGVICDAENKSIVVVGTEEFMYPAIKTAEVLLDEYNAASVVTHSTTRSPIEPHFAEGYPLYSRYSLKSFYEDSRQTYIYNTDYCDKVVIITDGDNDDEAVKGIIGAYDQCYDFIVMRWKY